MTNDRRAGDEPVDAARIAANWRAITIELDAPRPPFAERVLRRLGLPSHVTRVAVATPALRRSWYTVVAAAVVVGLMAAEPDRPGSALVMLAIAPFVPVIGVALAYGAAADPAAEIAVATPMRGIRLTLIRTATVLAVAAPIITLFALIDPTLRPMAAAWLLPALAVTGLALVVMTVTTPRRAASLAAVAWLATLLVVGALSDDRLAAFRWQGQVAAVAVATAAIVVLWSRRDHLDEVRFA